MPVVSMLSSVAPVRGPRSARFRPPAQSRRATGEWCHHVHDRPGTTRSAISPDAWRTRLNQTKWEAIIRSAEVMRRPIQPFTGYQVTAFTNDEEEAVGLLKRARWTVENELVEMGVDFTKGEMWKPYTVVDRNRFTGQNPASASVLAERLLKVL
ncbi:hypothetical protein ACIQ9J_24375 [Streptomyces sp. NPDC094153]|uniref:hypothetical protein n=1 Tax=Streptomyces sp. NPDC094153 TaxID=3366058 RepID=UPI0038086704